MMVLERVAEGRLADGVRHGAFDGRIGRGQGLDLDDAAAVPPEWRVTFRLLMSAGECQSGLPLGGRSTLQSRDSKPRLQAARDRIRGCGPRWRR
jgi:hypothetical protein